jgi:hypothetical protein
MTQSLIRRATGAIVVFMLALGVLVGTATAASAEKRCKSESGRYVACLSVSHKGGGIYEIGVGIDVILPPAEVQQILANNPAGAFSASLMADDEGPNDVALIPIPLTAVSGFDNQLSAEFGRDVGHSIVNEDSGTDELYARVTLFNKATNVTRTFDTAVVSANF